MPERMAPRRGAAGTRFGGGGGGGGGDTNARQRRAGADRGRAAAAAAGRRAVARTGFLGLLPWSGGARRRGRRWRRDGEGWQPRHAPARPRRAAGAGGGGAIGLGGGTRSFCSTELSSTRRAGSSESSFGGDGVEFLLGEVTIDLDADILGNLEILSEGISNGDFSCWAAAPGRRRVGRASDRLAASLALTAAPVLLLGAAHLRRRR